VLAPRGSAVSVAVGFALALLALLAALLLLDPSLLLAFLALLLLATAAGKTPYQALRLVCHPSDVSCAPCTACPA
jgi:hypothetical protein